MSLNVKKSACLRVGNRFNIDCSKIVTKQGCEYYHGLRVYVTLGYTWFQSRPLNVSQTMPNAPSTAPLMLYLGKLVESPPVRLLFS